MSTYHYRTACNVYLTRYTLPSGGCVMAKRDEFQLRVLVAMRLPPKIVDLLRYTARERGMSQSDLVSEALASYTKPPAIPSLEDLF